MFVDNVFNLCIFFGKIGVLDVMIIDQIYRQQLVRRQMFVQFSNVIFIMYEIDMQILNRQCSNCVEVWCYVFKIGGQQQFYLFLECVVSGFVCVQLCLWQFQYQCGFINLYLFDVVFCQFCQYLLINWQNVVQQVQVIKLFIFYFFQLQLGNWFQQYRFYFVVQRQRFVYFFQQLCLGQFELLVFNEFWYYVVIVGVKLFGYFCCCCRFVSWCMFMINMEQGVDIY